MTPAAPRYRTLLESLDAWTDEARSRQPGVLPCRHGCTACCHGPFDISVADVLLLRATAATLPAVRLEALTVRAHAAADRQRTLAPDWAPPHDIRTIGEARFDALCEALAAEPCPCLEDGACVVYEGRPTVCRMMGLGLAALEGHVVTNACPIQDDFPDYAALPPQPFDLAAFEAREEACLVEAGLALFGTASAAGYETTVAVALAGLPGT